MNCKIVLRNIRKEFKEYVTNAKLKSVVLGISGGIDSAIVAAIVKPVCENLKFKLIGVSLPSSSNKNEEVWRANEVMFNLCTEYKAICIDDFVNSFKTVLMPDVVTKEDKIAVGNIKARCRMITLYNIAFMNKGMVLGTDNLTEYNLGFWSLHGDVGDFSAIQYLWKTEVYALSQYIVDTELKDNPKSAKALQDCIDAVPTDGLGITNSDLDQIGVKTYAEVDNIFKDYLTDGSRKDSPVIQRHLRTEFKRSNPYCISRKRLFKE